MTIFASEKKISESPLILGHRGSSIEKNFPENTLPAFREALDLGADGIELDIYLSADEQLVVCHDQNLSRLTGIDRNIHDMNVEEIRQLRFLNHMNNPELYIPTLAEVFEGLGGEFICNIEVKKNWISYKKLVPRLNDFIVRNRLTERVWVSSFDPILLKMWHKTGSSVPPAFLFERWSPFLRWLSNRKFIKILHPSVNLPVSLKILERSGKKICFWTVNSTEDFLKIGKVKNLVALITGNVKLARKHFPGKDAGRT